MTNTRDDGEEEEEVEKNGSHTLSTQYNMYYFYMGRHTLIFLFIRGQCEDITIIIILIYYKIIRIILCDQLSIW